MEILKQPGIIFTKNKTIGTTDVDKKILKLKLSILDIIDIKYYPGFNKDQIQTELNKIINPKLNPDSVKISMPNPDDIYKYFYKYRVSINTIIMNPTIEGLHRLALLWNVKIDKNKIYK